MYLYRINGTVTLSRSLPTLLGGCLKTAHAYTLDSKEHDEMASDPDLLVLWDDFGASEGSIVAVSDGAEAAQPFRPELKPVDAYNAAIIDQIHRPTQL
jgi:carbon dioxide concentrating mechanism protein CcmL